MVSTVGEIPIIGDLQVPQSGLGELRLEIDGPDARVAREGSTTCTSAQAETPVTIITKQIRQPIGIRIKASLRAFSLQLCTAKCGEGKPPAFVLPYIPKVKTL